MTDVLVLLKKAFHRTKERFSLFIPFFALHSTSSLLFGFVLLFGAAYPKSPQIIVLFLIGGASLALNAFASLAMIVVLIGERRLGIREGLKITASYFRGFLWFSFVFWLFLFGFIPLGIASIFIIPILWLLWSVFAVFIYLEKRKRGLENLWISRAMVQKQFWHVARQVLLVGVPAVILSLDILFFFKNELMEFIASSIYALLFYPFMMSFFYELYKSLPEPKEVKTPKVWMILSAIGWIIIACILVIALFFPHFLPIPSTRPCVNTETKRCLTS